MNKNKIKLVIFDMDGVLIDSCHWHYVALNEALKELCNYEIPLDLHYAEYNGMATKIKLKKLYENGLITNANFKEIEDRKQEKTVEIINKLVQKKDEKVELLKQLKKNGIKVACYTNSIRLTAELILSKVGVLELLDKVYTNQDVIRTKPDPEGYVKCMEYFSVGKDECVIIEDSPKGLQAAHSSGAKVYQVKNSEDVDINIIEKLELLFL